MITFNIALDNFTNQYEVRGGFKLVSDNIFQGHNISEYCILYLIKTTDNIDIIKNKIRLRLIRVIHKVYIMYPFGSTKTIKK